MPAKKTTRRSTSNSALPFTIPGVKGTQARTVIDLLQERLHSLNDLAMTLKHAHWNVVGPQFIGVHQMLDPQVSAVRLMADETAERIATLGGEPMGTPGALVAGRSWEDYPVNRGDALTHLSALDEVYSRVVEAHREAIEKTGDADPVTEDLLIGQASQLEQFHWFVRAHLEQSDGTISHATSGRAGSRRRSA